MKLSVKNRLLILNILPSKGDFVTLTVKQDLVEKIKITQEEISEYEITSTEVGVTWNESKTKEVDIEFTSLENEMIKSSLKELDSAKELTDDTANLYKLFI